MWIVYQYFCSSGATQKVGLRVCECVGQCKAYRKFFLHADLNVFTGNWCEHFLLSEIWKRCQWLLVGHELTVVFIGSLKYTVKSFTSWWQFKDMQPKRNNLPRPVDQKCSSSQHRTQAALPRDTRTQNLPSWLVFRSIRWTSLLDEYKSLIQCIPQRYCSLSNL